MHPAIVSGSQLTMHDIDIIYCVRLRHPAHPALEVENVEHVVSATQHEDMSGMLRITTFARPVSRENHRLLPLCIASSRFLSTNVKARPPSAATT